jgi:hypothetical protein
MSFQQPPVQVGGGAILGSAGIKTLAATGFKLLKVLAAVGAGLVATGAVLARRGKNAQVDAGAPLD